MKNAKAADKSRSWFPHHDYTKMYKLVEALMMFVNAKEFNASVERLRKNFFVR